MLGSFICKLVPYLQGVSVCASVYTLVAVAVERYWSISSPWKKRLSSRSCRIIIGFIWIGSAIITLPWLVVFRQDYVSDTLVKRIKHSIPVIIVIRFDNSSTGLHGNMAGSVDGRRLLCCGTPDPVLRLAISHHRSLLRFDLPTNLVSSNTRQRRTRSQSPAPVPSL